MGLLSLLGVGKRTSDFLATAIDLGISSPWSEGDLTPLVIGDILGEDIAANLPLSRSVAISIPAVSKGRNLLVSTIAKFPLVALDTTGEIKNQPSFLYRTDSNVTPYERMAWTVDDLIFFGYSLWKVSRGTPDASGRRGILNAAYVPMRDWKVTNGHILIDDKPVDATDVILFNSPFEGLLNIANRTLRGAIDQEASWVGRARNPIPAIELHQTTDELTEDEVTAFVQAWAKARTSPNGAVGYTPPSIELNVHGDVQVDMAVEGRNAIRTDVGSFLNVRASMLDGTMGIDSLTYSTNEGEKNSFYEFDLPFWTDPITARLSMDDVVPRGQRVRFDMYAANHLPIDTGVPEED